MNLSKVNDPRFIGLQGRWEVSGALGTKKSAVIRQQTKAILADGNLGPDDYRILRPQVKAALDAAYDYEQEGNRAMAGMMRVEAYNLVDRGTKWQPVHCPNLGPHSASNPAICEKCGKPRGEWSSLSEPCPGPV